MSCIGTNKCSAEVKYYGTFNFQCYGNFLISRGGNVKFDDRDIEH